MKLSKVQQAVVDALRANPLSWVGSDANFRYRIILPARSEGLFGIEVKPNTFSSLQAKGVIAHRKLTDEQRGEYNTRKDKLSRHMRRSTHTHGYMLTDDWKQTS